MKMNTKLIMAFALVCTGLSAHADEVDNTIAGERIRMMKKGGQSQIQQGGQSSGGVNYDAEMLNNKRRFVDANGNPIVAEAKVTETAAAGAETEGNTIADERIRNMMKARKARAAAEAKAKKQKESKFESLQKSIEGLRGDVQNMGAKFDSLSKERFPSEYSYRGPLETSGAVSGGAVKAGDEKPYKDPSDKPGKGGFDK